MTVATWVCWSMNSETMIAYGSRVRRQGRSRPCARNQAASFSRRRCGCLIFDFGFSTARRTLPKARMASKQNSNSSDGPAPITLYTSPLTPEQANKLRALLTEDGYRFEPKPYTLYYASKDKLNVAVYEKGPKVVLQGKGTQDFVTFRLEPEVLGEARLGYEEVNSPEMFAPHFGVDESGKGDFFGPLVIAGCYTDA